eukprot:comp8627_c0_seq2/m.3919 comp8627_c0_seq2/g.3919  ORF comp8627_c0_seq2/g.3919 comp8627_c0_seq2/m.3919 type:complete len:369 (-) comp8627_c0_seq2:74-1180(-)
MLSPVAFSGLRAVMPVTGAVALAAVGMNQPRRQIQALARVGRGGRCSVNGITATVFGATGFIGRYLVNNLGKKGTQIIIPYRGDEMSFRHLRPMGDVGQIVFPEFQLRDYDSILQSVKYSDVVFNLIGRDYETRNFNFDDVHVEGAKMIAKACAEAGVERLIHVSALGAAPDSPSKYLKSKYAGEQAVKKAFPNATIVRPAQCFGPEDRFFNYIAVKKFVFSNNIPVARKAALKWPVFAIDVGRALAQCVEDAKAPGATFEFVGPRSYTNEELVQFFYHTTREEGRILQLPQFATKAFASGIEYLRDPFMTVDGVIREGLDDVPLGLPGIPDLGVELQSLNKVGIQFLRAYRKHMHYEEHLSEEEART